MKILKPELLLTAALMIVSCTAKQEAPNDPHAGEDDEHGSGQLVTLFTENTEYFVEFPHLVIDEDADFTVHLTRLDTYKPLNEGTVSVVLKTADREITASSSEPIREGIFQIELLPENAGTSEIQFRYQGEGFNEMVSLKDIVVFPSDDDVPETVESSGEEISFTKESAWNSDFMVSLLEPVPFSSVINAGGEILAMPGEKYNVHALSSGIVTFNKKDLVAGTHVLAGESMISLKGEGLAHESISVVFAQAESMFYRSKSDYERKKALIAENAVSEKEFIESHSAYLIDSVYYYNLENSFDSKGLKIVAPIEGHVHELTVAEGEFVTAGQLIATISSDEKLLLRADVPQQYFAQINDIVSANLRTSYSREVLNIDSLEGRLLAIGSSVAENNHFLPVYFEAINHGNLLEGAFAEFFLKTRVREESLVIPKSALVEEQGRYFVYVQTEGEAYLSREVFILDSDGMNYRIEKGLSQGERIVTRGRILLKTASISSALPQHNHEH
jgi:membrane fusion protein, heavy metal efflux system